MATHNDFGKACEALAAGYLRNLGYEILFQNWSYKQYEIDIIARKDGVLHFFEVKSRKSYKCGYPEDSVTKKKFRSLKRAVDEFLHLHPGNKHIQYDILSIVVEEGKEPDYFLLEDCYL